MRPTRSRHLAVALAVLLSAAAGVSAGWSAEAPAPAAPPTAPALPVVEPVEDYKTPGIETELSGIYPHPTDDNLYYVVSNGRPPYKPTMTPMLPVHLRNKLLTVNREGKVVKAVDLPDGGGLFGGIGLGDGHLWLGPLDPPELWKVEPETGKVVAEYSLPGPAGGLDFDRDRGQVYVHNYIGHPHIAVVDARTGVVVKTLWSDENCQGISKVDGDWLCVWTSSWEADAYTELWQLDDETGRPKTRTRLEGIHAGMAALDPKVAGFTGFMTVVHLGSGVTGETVIRRFRYRSERQRAAAAAAASAPAPAAGKAQLPQP